MAAHGGAAGPPSRGWVPLPDTDTSPCARRVLGCMLDIHIGTEHYIPRHYPTATLPKTPTMLPLALRTCMLLHATLWT
jgi:hypothetical protein